MYMCVFCSASSAWVRWFCKSGVLKLLHKQYLLLNEGPQFVFWDVGFASWSKSGFRDFNENGGEIRD